MKKLLGVFFAILLCGFLPAVSYSQQITIGLTGKIIRADDPCNFFGGQIKIGNTLTGTYTYDTSTQDSDPEGYSGAYWHYSTPCGVSVNINNFNFRTDPNNVLFAMGIGNNYPGLGDIYSFGSDKNLPLPNGALVESIVWQLTDSTGTALLSDALPTTAPNLANWDMDYGLTIRGPVGPCLEYMIRADITSVVLIPEPATLLLLAFGIAGICKLKS